MAAQGTGSKHEEPMPLAGQVFLGPLMLLVPVTPGVGADIVASSSMILGVFEYLGAELPLGVLSSFFFFLNQGTNAMRFPLSIVSQKFRYAGPSFTLNSRMSLILFFYIFLDQVIIQ